LLTLPKKSSLTAEGARQSAASLWDSEEAAELLLDFLCGLGVLRGE
jgi:hypothetical protein